MEKFGDKCILNNFSVFIWRDFDSNYPEIHNSQIRRNTILFPRGYQNKNYENNSSDTITSISENIKSS